MEEYLSCFAVLMIFYKREDKSFVNNGSDSVSLRTKLVKEPKHLGNGGHLKLGSLTLTAKERSLQLRFKAFKAI